MTRRWRIAAPLACLALAGPAAAAAEPTRAPPDNAGAQEFTETIPDGRGLYPTNDLADSILNRHGFGSMPRGRRRLERLGADGPEAASLAEAGSALAGVKGPRAEGTRPVRHRPPGDGPVEAVAERILAASGPGEMGLLLPIGIALVVVASLAAWRGRRAA